MNSARNRHILLVDDMQSIHDDFRRILAGAGATPALDNIEATLFDTPAQPIAAGFELDSAYQGREALERAEQALQAQRPFAMAFVDMRMPPGWDGVETIARLWRLDPRLQVVLCTAYSDYPWEEVLGRLDVGDRLLILKKPFDPIEVMQLADMLTSKWDLTRRAASKMDSLEQAVQTRTQELSNEMEVRRLAQAALQSANDSLLRSEERYRMLVELSADAILIECAGRIMFANHAARVLYRANQVADLLDLSMSALVVSESSPSIIDSKWVQQQQGGTHVRTEELALCLDGSRCAVEVTRLAFTYQGQPAVQMVVRDISEHKRMELQLQHQASHDGLTGLPNRNLLLDRLRQAIAQAQRHGKRLAVCFIDLDRFKWINDSLGHAAGDQLLKTVAVRIAACLRAADTVARIGGDEFILLLCDPGQVHDTELALKRVIENIARPMTLAGKDVSVTCSVGCSAYPDDAADGEELLKFADAAMYRAKEAGRNNLQIYNTELHRHLDERLQLESELRQAIERGQLMLHYQPQIDLRSGAIVGVEALLRWPHPELGNIPPARLIPLAEETGLIESIGAWVIQQACAQNKAWQLAGLPPLCVAVNVSAVQVERPGLEQHVAHCLAASGLAPAYLELEITESTAMRDLEKTIALMQRFKQLGVRLAIDDFGTGYSNLRSLARLPIDKLKLDGSFVRDIVGDPRSLAIAHTIVTMARQLGLQSLAEMVETEGQASLLDKSACDQVQGYYYSAALPPAELALLLQAGPMSPPGGQRRQRHAQTLLVLDDDQDMGRAVERALHFEPYRVLLATRAEEAFELLACNDVGVILCDQRLRETTGVEMLDKAKRLSPRTVRLLFSGYQDFDAMASAINQGAIYKYLCKPLDNEQLRATVADAFEAYDRLTIFPIDVSDKSA